MKLATTASLCNHQCVVSMLQKLLPVRCNRKSSIKRDCRVLRYQEKNWRSEIVFLILIHRNMIITMLRYAYFPQFRHSQWVKMHVTVMLAELCRICWLNHETNQQLRDKTITAMLSRYFVPGVIINKLNASLHGNHIDNRYIFGLPFLPF